MSTAETTEHVHGENCDHDHAEHAHDGKLLDLFNPFRDARPREPE